MRNKFDLKHPETADWTLRMDFQTCEWGVFIYKHVTIYPIVGPVMKHTKNGVKEEKT